jgi:small conductance mechanosensitive channel
MVAMFLLPILASIDFDSDQALEDVLRSGGRITLVLLLAVIVLWLTQRLLTPLLRVAIREHMEKQPEVEIKKRVETLSHVLYTTVYVVVAVVSIVTILPEFGVNAAPLIAGLGLVGLAVGFGAQNLVKDVINGMFILVENQYSEGDVINIAGKSGFVEDINLRRTVLRDQDGAVHFIPHSQITTATNMTKGFSRINLSVHVPFDADIDRVFEVIDKTGEDLAKDPVFGPKITAPPKALRVEDIKGGVIEVKIVGETAPMEQWEVMGELRRRLKRAFDAAGIPAGSVAPTVVVAQQAVAAATSPTAQTEEAGPPPTNTTNLG